MKNNRIYSKKIKNRTKKKCPRLADFDDDCIVKYDDSYEINIICFTLRIFQLIFILL